MHTHTHPHTHTSCKHTPFTHTHTHYANTHHSHTHHAHTHHAHTHHKHTHHAHTHHARTRARHAHTHYAHTHTHTHTMHLDETKGKEMHFFSEWLRLLAFSVIRISRIHEYRAKMVDAVHTLWNTNEMTLTEDENPTKIVMAKGRTFRGSSPGGSEIFLTRPDRPWGTTSLLNSEYLVIPRCKGAGVWRWPPTTNYHRG